MNMENYQHAFIVQRTPMDVFEAVTRVTDWWTINTDGCSEHDGDEFTVQFGDVHRTTQRVTEALPGERIVWHVTESHLPWLKDTQEWKGTDIMFAIEATPEGTRLRMTHIGLTPQVECFAQCEKGWDFFIGTSLFKLLSEGIGVPDNTQRTHMDLIGHVRPADA